MLIKATGYNDATVTETIIPKKSVDAAELWHYRSNVEAGGDNSIWVVGGSNILQITTMPDSSYQSNIYAYVINDTQYSVSSVYSGNITLATGAFPERGEYTVAVKAKGYEDIVYTAYCYEFAPNISGDTEDYALGSDIDLTVDGNGVSDDFAQSITEIRMGENEIIRSAYITAESGKITISSRAF